VEICTGRCSDFQASLLLQFVLVEPVFTTADDNPLSVLKISGYALFRLIADGEGKDARTNDKWLQAPRFKDARLLCEQWYPTKGSTIRARI